MPTRRPSVLLALAASFAAGHIAGADGGRAVAVSDDALWTTLDALPANVLAEAAWVRPLKFTPAAINLDGMRAALIAAPRERTQGAIAHPAIIALPMPDGSFQRFAVVESSIMEAPLAAKYPELKTYAARGIDDPTATGRLDITPAGFHGQVLSGNGKFYIDPVSRNDTTYYAAYDRNDLAPKGGGMQCTVLENEFGVPHQFKRPAMDTLAPLNFGTQLSQYRLAMAADGEYTAFQGGTVAQGLAAVVTTVNRVDGVYERDLAVRFVLVANNNLLIYTNASTDPYSNSPASAMLTQNQNTITSVIGSANYDVGHVFGTGGGGIAQLSCVCSSGNKAKGTSQSPTPTGDGFDIDYVAHEMGHQFGGNHTFNACSTAGPLPVEPGSGISIMAYAGICGTSNDLAPHSIPNFHISNILNEMRPFITGSGGTCATAIPLGNGIPFVEAGPNYTIPCGTPFMLTAAGTDPDNDAITYQWEQTDSSSTAVTGSSGIFPDTGVNPILISDTDTASPVRIIPALSNLLAGTVRKGETLPTKSRTLHMRCTVRDGKGGLFSDTMSVTTVATAGPFAVTAPTIGASLQAGIGQSVAWNVASTDLSPISTASVRIDLSIDGGVTWPVNLVASTPNTGSASVVLPNTPTTTARIRVMPVDNIFFNITQNFTITAAITPPCYANCDGSTDSPSLSANDFTCFLTKFRSGDSYANCDGSTDAPVLTASDFTCFLAAFRAGCP